MEVQALSSNVRMSPQKVREVTSQIQGMQANQALDLLRYIPRKSARFIAKTLASAIANAENNHGLSSKSLFVASATANQGVSIKRFRPAARGSAHPIERGCTHIRIVLAETTTLKK